MKCQIRCLPAARSKVNQEVFILQEVTDETSSSQVRREVTGDISWVYVIGCSSTNEKLSSLR